MLKTVLTSVAAALIVTVVSVFFSTYNTVASNSIKIEQMVQYDERINEALLALPMINTELSTLSTNVSDLSLSVEGVQDKQLRIAHRLRCLSLLATIDGIDPHKSDKLEQCINDYDRIGG